MRISRVTTPDGCTTSELTPENDDEIERLEEMLASGRVKPQAGPTPAGRRSKCPVCGSRSVARIEYGMPPWTAENEQLESSGRIWFGGCCVSGNDPNRHCNHCGHEWQSVAPARTRT